MTEAELLAVEERAKAATPGPWEVRRVDWRQTDDRCDGIFGPDGSEIVKTDSGVYPPEKPDALFIARARSDIPALLAEVRRLRALVDNADARETQLRERIAEAMDF